MKSGSRQQYRSVCFHTALLTFMLGICFVLSAPNSEAQSTGGRIRGTVTDTSGAAVVAAKVTLINEDTNATREAQTSATGEYLFLEVPVGSYEIDVVATGFKKYQRKGVVLVLNEIASVDVSLQVGGSTETVEVSGAPPVIDTTTTQLGAVMTDQSVRELPLSTRNTYQLLQLQPGVQSQLGADLFYGSDNPGVVSVNGGRGRSNNYMVNGGDGNDIFVNGPAIQPSPDAIEEFRVLTNTFDAEYGRNSGSIVNVVTKSGTNNIHGDVYEFFRNKVLNTKGFFDPTVPDYQQNQFGATLGGPIKKDKSFLFGSYEGNRLKQGISSGNVYLPTSQMVSQLNNASGFGDFSSEGAFQGAVTDNQFASTLLSPSNRPGCASAIQAIAAPGAYATLQSMANNTVAEGSTSVPYSQLFPGSKIPTACFDPTAVALYKNYVQPYGTGQIATIPNLIENDDQFTFRFDQNFSPTQHFTAYYYFDDVNQTQPFSNFQAAGANLPTFGGLFKTRVQQVNLAQTSTIGSTSVNEFRFNWFREGQGDLNHPTNILPSLHDACGTYVTPANCFADPLLPTSTGITTNIPGHEGVPFVSVAGGFAIGNNFEGELPQTGNTYQFSDNFSKVLGTHSVKFGGDFRIQDFSQFLYYNINGDFLFQNGGSDNSLSPAGTASNPSPDAYADYFLGTPTQYSQGAAQGLNTTNYGLYLFAQDSWKIKPNLTLNYGLRWELNTPYVDSGNRLQTFRPGQDTTQYPCWLSPSSEQALGATSQNCGPNSANNAYFPTGLVFPGDKGVPRGLTSTYYNAWAPRIGMAFSPSWSDGILGALAGGPGKSTIRAGFGLFYNPMEQLVLEQFSAEPPFGISTFVSSPLFNTPYLLQNGTTVPNNGGGVITQTPSTPCPYAGGPAGCVDWSLFRPILLYGEFQPHLRTQYAEQYNLTIERQLSSALLLRVAYVGTQAHRLLASQDLNYGNPQTCLDINSIPGQSCGPFYSDSAFSFTVPAGMTFHMPYIPGPNPNGPNTPCPYGKSQPAGCTIVGGPSGTPVTLVGLRPYSSPNCNPYTGTGCPSDGVPVISNIFSENTVGNSNYNGLQISLEQNFSHGLLFQASYTYSKAIDQGASFENELNPIYPNATRGLSLLDAANRFVFSPVWQLPIPKKEGVTGKFVNGWQVSAIITYQSGFPIRVQDQNDSELMSSIFFESTNTPYMTAPLQRTNPKTTAGNYWFNTANFCDATYSGCPQALGTFGNTPHALCCGPALNNTDLVIAKMTPITEKLNTEFRAEFYNTWNHTQFENPDGNFSDSTFGEVLKARDPRVMQFAIKFLF
ncbi:MAG TPA: carboxypeptidase regulatory-like domain-containing protein [Verrucomicrobiae bacterium]|nr:carboxypeptidase regulatory-like domain-containing protein [Verrucomicrobiae bacterium]